MKRFKVYVNYEVTGHLFVMAEDAVQAETLAAKLIKSKNFVAPFDPQIVDGTMTILSDVTDED